MSNLIEHSGVVTNIVGDSVEVLIEQTSACASCSARMACATSDMQQKSITACAAHPLCVGDNVVVYGEQNIGLRAVMLAFVLPLIIMVVVLALASRITSNEALAAICSLVAIAPYFATLAHHKEHLARRLRFYAKKA